MTDARRGRGGKAETGGRLLVAAVVLGTAGVGGCYNPKIVSGHLQCAAPPAKACPDDFRCQGGVCVADGSAGTGGTGTGGAAPGTGGAAPGTGGMPGTGGAGGTVGGPVRLVGQTCTIFLRGQSNQSDNCDANLVCMDDCAGSRCYQYCQNDADCAASSCTRVTLDGSRKLCEIPFTTCDPQDGHTGCSNVAQGCYLLSPDPSSTNASRLVCDCAMGSGSQGAACSDSRDCFPGYVCPPMGIGPGAGYCARVCEPSAADPGCQGTTCHAFGATWGYCYL